MTTHIIFWWNAARSEREYEEFESLDDAEMALASWEKLYPHNTYTLAKVVRRVIATQRQQSGEWSVAPPAVM